MPVPDSLFATIAALSLVASCQGSSTADLPIRDDIVASLETSAASGEATFGAECATCHGTDGCGNEPLGPDLAISDQATVISNVLWGTGRMPELGSYLTDQEVADAVAYATKNFTALCTAGGDAGVTDASSLADGGHMTSDGGHVTTDGGQRDAGFSQEIVDFCNCAIVDCHDPFHARYGDDHDSSIAMCRVETTENYRLEGSPQTSGRSVECLQSKCDGSCPADIFTTACVD